MLCTSTKRLFLNASLVFGSALVVIGCSSTDEKAEPELENSQANTGADGESEAKAPKQPITDDGYDDDWNNMGTQQQKQNNQAKNNDKPADENNATDSNALNAAEPPLENQPALNQAQVPADEPPLDNEPAPFPEQFAMAQQVAPEPISEPAVAPVLTLPTSLASGAPLLKPDVVPVTALLTWLGYDYIERDSMIRIEMVTKGSPKFNIFQERNQANQPELVVRFFQTGLRDKVRRDIDASEFRSPVAYVRMRYDEIQNSVDVIMTMRDIVQPRLYAKYGNVLLTFAIPDHYFGNSTVGRAPVAKAEMLPNTNVMPEIDAGSDLPEGVKIAKAFISDPGAIAFKDVPEGGGEPVTAEPLPAEGWPETLPADFSNVPTDGEPVNGGNFATNQAANVNAEGDDELFGDNLGAQGSNEELDGENLGAENFNFDADTAGGLNSALAPSANAAPVQAEQQQGNLQQAEAPADDETDELDDEGYEGDDELEDGGTEEEINKFDVRVRSLRAPAAILAVAMGLMIEMPFTATAVGQDNLGQVTAAEEGDLGDASLDGNPANQGTNQAANQGGEANFGANGGGEADFSNDNANFFGDGGNDPDAAFGNTGNGTNTGNNTGTGSNNDFSNGNNVPANNALPVNNVVPFNSANAAFAGEPVLEGVPDLAGEEQVGSDTDAAPTPSAGGRPIKLDFRGAPLTEVIRALGDESRVNFVFPPDIGAKQIWINLQGVPFNDALRAVLESNALGMLELGPNLVRIDTLERIATDKEAEERRRKAEVKLRPTKVLVHRMSFSKAEEAAKMLEPMLAAAKTEDPRVTVQFDARTNSVIVNAPPSQLSMVKALLERIDLETPQVKISSRVVEVIKNAAEDFGISWFPKLNFDQGRGLGFGNLTFPNSMTSRYSVDAGGVSPRTGNMQFSFGSINDAIALDLALSMQESMGTSEVLQTSNVVVEDNTKAEVLAGSTDYFSIPAARAGEAPTVLEVKYNLAMNVTPHVTADGSVKLNIELTSDDPGTVTPGALASKNNRLLKTSMIRRSGETAVIGGVISNTNSKSQAGVPYLSSIPIIGALFRSSGSQEKKRELMVMVTPTIIGVAKGDGFAGAESVANVAVNSGNFGNDNAGNFDGGEDDSLDGAQTQTNQGGNNNFGNEALNQQNSGNQAQQNANNANEQVEPNNAANNQQAAAQNQQGGDEQVDAEAESDEE